ncbi:MAG: caspase family protein [Neomegalonema sp.]|nr:caspase family protein [Neomegalonema sp.]
MFSIVQRLMAVAILTGALAASPAAWARSVALVIGNSDYKHAAVLRNPGNDAEDIAKALKAIGFEVTLHKNLRRSALVEAIDKFGEASSGAERAVVYFAGHGIEVDGRNFLIPTDAKLIHARQVSTRAMPLAVVLDAVSGATFRLVILDACRDNPLARKITRGTRNIGRGLARVEPRGGQTMVAFAAAAGALAQDGDGRNSPYAKALIEALKGEKREVRLLLGGVRDRTMALTRGAQEPHVYGSLGGRKVYLHTIAATSLSPKTPTPKPPASRVAPRDDQAATALALAMTIETPSARAEALKVFLRGYPTSPLRRSAKAALMRAEAAADSDSKSREPDKEVAARTAWMAVRESRSVVKIQAYRAEHPSSEFDGFAKDRIAELTKEFKAAQRELKRLKLYSGATDGIWGRRSAAALRVFERKLGSRKVNGVLDPADIVALRAAPTPRSAPVKPKQRIVVRDSEGAEFIDEHGRTCKRYRKTITIGGKSESAEAISCRTLDGLWEIK